MNNQEPNKYQVGPITSDFLPLKQFFLSKDLSDCCFVFIKQEDASQQGRKKKKAYQHRISAHKFVLAAHSPVFKTMFYEHTGMKDEVFITGISSDTFESILKYIYTEEAISDDDDLFELFLAADQYSLGKVLCKIENKLMTSLSIDNVMKLYETFNQIRNTELIGTIGTFIQQNTHLILKHASFIEIQRQTLNFVLSQQELNAIEIQLFQACLRWAKAECERNSIENPTSDQLREALGDELFLIRIPTMSIKHFMDGPMVSGLLDCKEQNELLVYIRASIKPEMSTSDFVSRFRSVVRNKSQRSSLFFFKHLKHIPACLTVKSVISTLQMKSSDDFLLFSFYFGPILVPFSVTSVLLLEDSSPIFIQENMPYIQVKKKSEANSNFYSIQFPLPQLILANLTYKLTLTVDLNEMSKIMEETKPDKFLVKYERKSEKNEITIEMENFTKSDLNIYQFNLF